MADELKKDILAAIVDEEQDEDDLDVPIQPTNDSSNQDQIVIDDAHRYLLDKKALIAHYRKTNNQQNDNTFILLSEGNLLLTKKKIYDAANKYISAIDLFDKDALLSLGELFLYIKNYSQAQILLETAYELGIRNETLFENICHVYELLDKYHEIIDFIIKNELSFKKKEMFLGNAYFAINELKDAEKNYLLAVERKQYEIIPNLFACYEKLEQFDDADKFLDYLVSINYTPPPFIVGSYYFIKKDYINAKKHLLSVEKKDSNVLHFLAVSCDNLEQYDEANQYFQELLQSNYQADYAWEYIVFLQKVDKEDETVPLLDQLVKERTDLKALDQLGQYFEKNKDYEKAQNFYLSAVLKGYNDSIFRLGALYWTKLNNYNMALRYLTEADNKGNANATIMLGDLHYKKTQYDLALKFYLRGIAQIKSDKTVALTNFKIAKIYTLLKDEQRAFEYYNLIANDFPQARFEMANFYYRKQDFINAEKLYESVFNMKIDDPNKQLQVHLAKIYNLHKDYEKAGKIVVPLLAEKNRDILVAAAEVFIYENKIAEAQSCLNDAVKVLDNGFELGHAYFLTGTIHFENNDFISAKKDYEMAIKNGYVDANYELAEINFFTDNYHSATDCYLQAYKYLTNERKKIITLYALIDLALIEKNYQLIIKYLYMIIQLKDYRALDLAAHIFSGDYSFAIGMLIDEKNQDDIKNVLLAKLYICKGEFSLARNLCQKLVEKQINCAYCLLGNISEINKNAEDAKNYYLQGANLKDCYTLNYLANAALSSQQIDKALIYYLQSCELADPDGIMQTALIYGRLAKFDQAADLYKRAINIVNRNDLKNVYFNLAIAYAKIGKNELIVPTFVKAFWYKNQNAAFNLLKIFSKNNNLPEIKKYVSAVIDVLLLLDDDQLNEITNNKTNEYANLVLKSIFSDDHELNEEEIIASDKLMTRFLANDTSLWINRYRGIVAKGLINQSNYEAANNLLVKMLIESDADAFNDSFEVICTNFKIIKEHAPMFYNKLVDIAYDYLKDGISPKTAPILNRFGSFFSTIKDYNNLLSFFFSFVPKVKNEQFPVLGKQIVNSLLELEKQQDKERIKKEVWETVKANLDLIESNESKDFIIQTLKRYSQILMRFNYLSELLISLYERMLRDLKGQEYCANAEVLGHIYLMNKQESNAHIIATEYAKYSKITDLTNQPDNVVAKWKNDILQFTNDTTNTTIQN